MATRAMEKPDNGGVRTEGGKPESDRRPASNPRCIKVGDAIQTSRDFAEFMSVLIGDIVSGRIDPRTANAACNAGGKLLHVVELEHKYGRKHRGSAPVGTALQLA